MSFDPLLSAVGEVHGATLRGTARIGNLKGCRVSCCLHSKVGQSTIGQFDASILLDQPASAGSGKNELVTILCFEVRHHRAPKNTDQFEAFRLSRPEPRAKDLQGVGIRHGHGPQSFAAKDFRLGVGRLHPTAALIDDLGADGDRHSDVFAASSGQLQPPPAGERHQCGGVDGVARMGGWTCKRFGIIGWRHELGGACLRREIGRTVDGLTSNYSFNETRHRQKTGKRSPIKAIESTFSLNSIY